jgi:hypothetical protein
MALRRSAGELGAEVGGDVWLVACLFLLLEKGW